MEKSSTILKRPVTTKTLTKQYGKGAKVKARASVIGELKRKNEFYLHGYWGKKSLIITNMNLLIRFNKTRKIFSSITRVLGILLSTSATTASADRANFRRRIAF